MRVMWSDDDSQAPRPPQGEPEILPPERAQRRQRAAGQVWIAQHQIVFTRPGPLQLLLGFLLLAAILAVGALALLGIVLLWLPVMAVTVVAVIVATLVRRGRRS
jgi:hypothetical protein